MLPAAAQHLHLSSPLEVCQCQSWRHEVSTSFVVASSITLGCTSVWRGVEGRIAHAFGTRRLASFAFAPSGRPFTCGLRELGLMAGSATPDAHQIEGEFIRWGRKMTVPCHVPRWDRQGHSALSCTVVTLVRFGCVGGATVDAALLRMGWRTHLWMSGWGNIGCLAVGGRGWREERICGQFLRRAVVQAVGRPDLAPDRL